MNDSAFQIFNGATLAIASAATLTTILRLGQAYADRRIVCEAIARGVRVGILERRLVSHSVYREWTRVCKHLMAITGIAAVYFHPTPADALALIALRSACFAAIAVALAMVSVRDQMLQNFALRLPRDGGGTALKPEVTKCPR